MTILQKIYALHTVHHDYLPPRVLHFVLFKWNTNSICLKFRETGETFRKLLSFKHQPLLFFLNFLHLSHSHLFLPFIFKQNQKKNFVIATKLQFKHVSHILDHQPNWIVIVSHVLFHTFLLPNMGSYCKYTILYRIWNSF